MRYNVGKLEYAIVESIINTVCDYYEFDVATLKSKTRTADIVHARQVCCYLVRKYTDVSKFALGKVFFDQDHSTVVHSCNVIKEEIETGARGTKFDVKNLCDIIDGKIPVASNKFKAKFGIRIKCAGTKDEYYGFWDNPEEASAVLHDRINAVIKDQQCTRSGVIRVKIINNA